MNRTEDTMSIVEELFLRLTWIFALTALIVASLTGCTALNNATAGLPEKAVSLNGTVMLTKVGVDASKIPTVFSMVNTGDYTSIPAGMEFIKYKETADASIFNSEAKSTSKFLVYGSGDVKKTEALYEALVEKFRKAEDANDR